MDTLRRFFNKVFSTDRYTGLVEKDQARLVYAIGMLMLILAIIFVTVDFNGQGATLLKSATTNPTTAFFIAFFFTASISSLVLVRLGRLPYASFALVLAFTVTLGGATARGGYYNASDALGIVPILVLSGLLFGQRGLIIGTVVTMVIMAIALSNRSYIPPPVNFAYQFQLISSLLIFLVIGGMIYLTQRFARLSRVEAVAGERVDRLRLATITSQVSQRISRRMALNDVLNNTIEQIRDSYQTIYHVQIFLLDDNRKTAQLVASTGEVGRLLMERKHKLDVGSQSVIGQVTALSKPVVAKSAITTDDGRTIHRRNELLPETAVEAAFPLRIGDMVIGALDLQSKLDNAFEDDELPIFQSLTDHIAIAIDNARLFEETEKQLAENRALVERTRQTAMEIERLNHQLTGRFWEDYLEQRGDISGLSVGFNGQGKGDADWTQTLKEAVRYNHVVQESQDGAQVIAVPLRVRGQVIGAMEFELDDAGNLAPEDLNLIEEVGEQLGMAAETNRLFESTQRIAQREALVNEIATRLQASNNVETTLNTAARSLKETLKANRVSIRLGTPPSNGNRGKGGQA